MARKGRDDRAEKRAKGTAARWAVADNFFAPLDFVIQCPPLVLVCIAPRHNSVKWCLMGQLRGL